MKEYIAPEVEILRFSPVCSLCEGTEDWVKSVGSDESDPNAGIELPDDDWN